MMEWGGIGVGGGRARIQLKWMNNAMVCECATKMKREEGWDIQHLVVCVLPVVLGGVLLRSSAVVLLRGVGCGQKSENLICWHSAGAAGNRIAKIISTSISTSSHLPSVYICGMRVIHVG